MNSPTVEVLYRIKRSLAGYISYLAACDVNTVFSEYLLYEPILRTLGAQGFLAHCEVPCLWLPYLNAGDRRRIDFTANKGAINIAIEVKWPDAAVLNVERDMIKLASYLVQHPGSRSFLCVFGRDSFIHAMLPDKGGAPVLADFYLDEMGAQVTAQFGVTCYGCRIFEVKQSAGTTTVVADFL